MPITAEDGAIAGGEVPAECVDIVENIPITLGTSAVFPLSGNGGNTGQYRIKVVAGSWNGGTVSFGPVGGAAIATWSGDGRASDVTTVLAGGNYQFSYGGVTLPSGLFTTVDAV